MKKTMKGIKMKKIIYIIIVLQIIFLVLKLLGLPMTWLFTMSPCIITLTLLLATLVIIGGVVIHTILNNCK